MFIQKYHLFTKKIWSKLIFGQKSLVMKISCQNILVKNIVVMNTFKIKKNGNLVTSAKKEEGGSGQKHDLEFLINSDKSHSERGVKDNCRYLLNVLSV